MTGQRLNLWAGRFNPRQLEALNASKRHTYTMFGGSRGPGKSYWLRWALLWYLLRFHAAGLRGVRVGLFCEDYPSLTDRQISKIATEFPRGLGRLKQSRDQGLAFHLSDSYGGGILALRNLDDPTKYQSAEFAVVGVDELTKNPVTTFNTLRGSMRWPGVPAPKFLAATNPGSIGHLWVKAYWVDRQYPPELAGLAPQFSFVRALPDDNPMLDKAYWEMLDTLPPELARAWRWGEWDVFEGQVFSEWRTDAHIVQNFQPPAHWPKWRAVDWGYANPFCCLWLTQDPDIGRVRVYRELYQTKATDRQQARLIKANTAPDEQVNITLADPSMWTLKNMEDKTYSTADEYAAEGVPLSKADNDRLIGWRKIHTMLAPGLDGLPMLQIGADRKSVM